MPLIRPSQEQDIAAVQAIYAHHVLHGTGTFETEPPTEADMAQRRRDVLSRDLPWLVAEGDDGLAVTTPDTDRVGDVAFRAGVGIRELTRRTASLEEAFLELTSGSQQFAVGTDGSGSAEMPGGAA